MKVGIDCRFWLETDLGKYTRNIVPEIISQSKTESSQKHITYVLFVNNEPLVDVNGHEILTAGFSEEICKVVKTRLKATSSIDQLFFSFLLLRHKTDLLFVPNQIIPLPYVLLGRKFFVTIHDTYFRKLALAPESYFNTLPNFLKKKYHTLKLFVSLKLAAKVFAVSENVKADITKDFLLSPEKVVVTFFAPSAGYQKRYSDEVTNVLSKYEILKPYILYVGPLNPLKNLDRLFIAFDTVSREYPNYMFVVVKKENPLNADISLGSFKKFHTHFGRKMFKFINSFEERDLPVIYTNSEMVVNPSVRENSFVSMLESFACRVRYVCSNLPEISEVAGNIPYYFNYKDPAKISETIIQCIKDESSAKIEAGFELSHTFKWETSAAKVTKEIETFYSSYFRDKDDDKEKKSKKESR